MLNFSSLPQFHFQHALNLPTPHSSRARRVPVDTVTLALQPDCDVIFGWLRDNPLPRRDPLRCSVKIYK